MGIEKIRVVQRVGPIVGGQDKHLVYAGGQGGSRKGAILVRTGASAEPFPGQKPDRKARGRPARGIHQLPGI